MTVSQSGMCEHVFPSCTHIHTEKYYLFWFADVKIKNVVDICCFVMTVPFSSSYSVGKKTRGLFHHINVIW